MRLFLFIEMSCDVSIKMQLSVLQKELGKGALFPLMNRICLLHFPEAIDKVS